jgi:hypothetical protein
MIESTTVQAGDHVHSPLIKAIFHHLAIAIHDPLAIIGSDNEKRQNFPPCETYFKNVFHSLTLVLVSITSVAFNHSPDRTFVNTK